MNSSAFYGSILVNLLYASQQRGRQLHGVGDSAIVEAPHNARDIKHVFRAFRLSSPAKSISSIAPRLTGLEEQRLQSAGLSCFVTCLSTFQAYRSTQFNNQEPVFPSKTDLKELSPGLGRHALHAIDLAQGVFRSTCAWVPCAELSELGRGLFEGCYAGGGRRWALKVHYVPSFMALGSPQPSFQAEQSI